MPELIERDALKNHLYRAQAEAFKHSEWYVAGAIQSFIELLDKQPTIEAEPVRHGQWIHSDPMDYKDPNGVIHLHGMCSCCRLIYDFRDMTSRFKFCPNCGARMDALETCCCISDEEAKKILGGVDNG